MSTIDKLILKQDTSDQYMKELMTALILGSKSSNSIPNTSKGNDYDYYMSSNTEFKTLSRSCTNNIIDLIEDQFQFVSSALTINPKEHYRHGDDDSEPENAHKNAVIFEKLTEVIDGLLEAADIKLDEAMGRHKDVSTMDKQLTFALDKESIMCSRTVEIEKPQLAFQDDINNDREILFRPRLVSKPFPITALEYITIPVENSSPVRMKYQNPYLAEIDSFSLEISQKSKVISNLSTQWFNNLDVFVNNKCVPKFPLDKYIHDIHIEMDVTKLPVYDELEYIDTLDGLLEFIECVSEKNYTELAIDLEHHNYRSFQGITCLMQLSTRDKDYIIDVLALRLEMHRLLHIFANPHIVKVFHGCQSDNLWLQKDFGLYLVNCFDTYHACKVLKFPACSLAHLLKYYCGIIVDKKHQLSDWRVRPLPEDMILYARSDTHYLLHIYDKMRFDVYSLLGRSGLVAVCEATKVTLSDSYEKPVFQPNGYIALIDELNMQYNRKHTSDPYVLTPLQDTIMCGLFDWRDARARALDESLLYICSNSELYRLATVIPQTESELLSCKLKSGYIVHTTSAKQEILDVIKTQIGGVGSAASKVKGSSMRAMAIDEENAKQYYNTHVHVHSRAQVDSVMTFIPATTSTPTNAFRIQSNTKPYVKPLKAMNMKSEATPNSAWIPRKPSIDEEHIEWSKSVIDYCAKKLRFAHAEETVAEDAAAMETIEGEAGTTKVDQDFDEMFVKVEEIEPTVVSKPIVSKPASDGSDGESQFPPSLASKYDLSKGASSKHHALNKSTKRKHEKSSETGDHKRNKISGETSHSNEVSSKSFIKYCV